MRRGAREHPFRLAFIVRSSTPHANLAAAAYKGRMMTARREKR